MRILGIDPGLNITGYGLISVCRDNGCALEEAGIIRSPAGKEMPVRLKKIFEGTKEIIREGKPEVLVLEDLYSHYRHPRTAIIMGHARGIICLAAAEENIPVVGYSATQVKKAVCGSGQASKGQIMRTVHNLLNLQSLPKYNDVTDALALAVAHVGLNKISKRWVEKANLRGRTS